MYDGKTLFFMPFVSEFTGDRCKAGTPVWGSGTHFPWKMTRKEFYDIFFNIRNWHINFSGMTFNRGDTTLSVSGGAWTTTIIESREGIADAQVCYIQIRKAPSATVTVTTTGVTPSSSEGEAGRVEIDIRESYYDGEFFYPYVSGFSYQCPWLDLQRYSELVDGFPDFAYSSVTLTMNIAGHGIRSASFYIAASGWDSVSGGSALITVTKLDFRGDGEA